MNFYVNININEVYNKERKRRMENEQAIKDILIMNQKYKANNWNGIKEKGDNFKIICGNSPILFSAPHAVRQSRDGELKSADTMTGVIVEALCQRTKASGIIRTFNLNDDPNWENSGYGLKYKNAILDIINQRNILCMIDIHGCKSDYGFDIDIGTDNGKNINMANNFLNIINNGLIKCGKVETDKIFSASDSSVISKYINRKSNIACFQIEISSAIRKDMDRLIQLLDTFEEIIKNLEIEIEKMKVCEERD